jgi:hypothetical protein
MPSVKKTLIWNALDCTKSFANAFGPSMQNSFFAVSAELRYFAAYNDNGSDLN